MHLNIGQRIMAGFALIILLTIGLGVFEISNIEQMRALGQVIVEVDFKTARLLRRIGEAQRDMQIQKERATVLHFYEKTDVTDRDSSVAQQQWDLARQRTLSLIDQLATFAAAQKDLAQDDRKRLYAQIEENVVGKRELLNDISSVVKTQFDALNRDDLGALKSQIAVLDALRQKFSDLTDQSEALAAQLALNAEDSIMARYSAVRVASLLALAAVVAVGIAGTWLLHRSITRPLNGFMAFVDRVGQGDLTQKTANTGRDEVGRLGQYLNDMVGGLAEAARQSRDATARLNSATAELQASAKQQASSTSEQSAAIQQITSTLGEVAQSGGQISERAKAVATAAEATSSISKSGLEAVADTSRAMSAIGDQAEAVAGNIVALTEKAQSIGEIIAGVNDIAERSDLLALNAAIEAAAAGEDGRSFAVIADEMKSLATQAKESTRQVRELLGDIQQGISASVMQTEEAVKRAATGQQKTAETESTIRSLVESVEESVATFQQIVAATNQQQIGIEQVASSVQNIREASEQMAAGIRDLEQSAVNLSALSIQLQRSVERYVV